MDNTIPESVVNAACEAAWPEFRSHLEGQQAWIDADPLRQNRLRFIVIQALTAAQQQEQAVVWVSTADIAPFVGAPQMAEFWAKVTLSSGPGDGRTVPLYLTAPPNASVGVEASYHPCTSILIEGLKRLEGGDEVLAEWDRARAKADTALAYHPSAKETTT